MYIHVLLFYNICLLTDSGIKIFVDVNEAENILHFYKYSVSFQPCYAFGFSSFSLILCLEYA